MHDDRSWLLASVLMLALVLPATSALASPPPKLDAHGVLETSSGMALYTYTPDGSTSVSHCTGPCASVWPPYLADPGAHPAQGFSLVTRSGHTLQLSYRGRPLYCYAADSKRGEALGAGVNGVWHVAHIH